MSASDPIVTPAPSSTKTLAAGVVVAALLAGLLVGIAGDRVYLIRVGRLVPAKASSGQVVPHLVDRLDRDLHFTPQQKTQVTKILQQRHDRIDALMRSVRPQVRQEMEATNTEIEKLLTPEQRTKFETIKMRFARGRGRDDNGGPPGPPPDGPGHGPHGGPPPGE